MIKKLLQNLKDSFKKYITNHICTNIVLVIISLLIIVIDLEDPTEFVQRLITTLFLMAMFTLLGESCTKEKKKEYLIDIIGLIISIFASKFIIEWEQIRYVLGIILSVGFAILYFMANNSKETTNKYLTNTATNLLKLGIVGSVLNIGIMLILGLISTLLIELDEIVFVKTEILVLVLYYIPALIISLETKEEENKFIYSLVNYVALPLVAIATAIIYVYIAKLLVTLKLPHTQTFAINAVLLSFGIPIVLMVLSYDKETPMTKVANILKKLYIPFIGLQIFALSLRIHDYSITTSRYFGIILIILGILSLVLLNKNNGNQYKYILLPCIVISIIACMFPYINAMDYPNHMQINRLKEILPKGKSYDDLTKEEIADVRSIYYYVTDKKYYPKYLSREKVKKLLYNYKDIDYYYDDEDDFISYRPEDEKIDITNYKEMEAYTVYTNYDGFVIPINGEEYDLTKFCKNLYKQMKKNVDIYEYMDENRIISLDDKKDLYITDIELDYSNNHLALDGYILYKEYESLER